MWGHRRLLLFTASLLWTPGQRNELIYKLFGHNSSFRAIAASAPVFWFPQTNVPEDIFDNIVKRSFVNSGCKSDAIIAAWSAIEELANSGTSMWMTCHLRVVYLRYSTCTHLKVDNDPLNIKRLKFLRTKWMEEWMCSVGRPISSCLKMCLLFYRPLLSHTIISLYV